MFSTAVLWAAFLCAGTTSQETALPGPQCQDFASSFALSASQISRANISNITAHNVEIAINFERSNWATNSVTTDPFYRIPSNWSSSLPPGTLLTVEDVTNTSLYTLPASVSLSRITYQTETLNGTAIPTSAYILWPYLARTFPLHPGLPVIGWGHGTSGMLAECAPSHIRNLWYQYSAPFTMALQGYVVVAPDYAGLGISTASTAHPSPPDADGRPAIPHPWLAAPAQAADILHAVAAAQAAFPRLSRAFVVAGHSQGGSAAWAAAAALRAGPSPPGYLGAVAASPAPAGDDYRAFVAGAGASALAAYAARGVLAAYPEVPPGELFTAEGLRRWRLLEEVGGCSSAASQLFAAAGVEVVRPGWGEHWAVRAFVERVEYSGRELAAGGRPLLVMQGVEDPFVLAEWTGRAVGRTCAAFPGSSVEYATFEGVGHVPVMYAGQRVWLDWVADRFAGVPVGGGCRNSSYGSVRDVDSYLKDFNYFLEPVTSPYQVA